MGKTRKVTTVRIAVTKHVEVDVWRGPADEEEGEPAGWRAIIRTGYASDLYVGPYDTKARLMLAVRCHAGRL